MWADTLSPVAFAPPPAAPHSVRDYSGASANSRDDGFRPQRRFVSQPNASAPTALGFDIDSIPLRPIVDEGSLNPVWAALAERLQFLRVEAEIENIPFSESSRDALWSFVREINPTARPRLYLNENGNLRALWRNAEGEQIGLEFLGGRAIQFVIFKRRERIAAMARIAGVEADDRIFAHLRASEVQGLLFA